MAPVTSIPAVCCQQKEVAEGCCCPVLVPRWGHVQGWQRSRAGAGPCSHHRAPAAQEPEGSLTAPSAGVPTGNASQIAPCLAHPYKLAMWKLKRCRGQLRSLRTHCSHKGVLCIRAWSEPEPVNQRKGFSCISSNSHKVIQHGYGQQGMGFGASAAEVLHLFSAKGQMRLQREKDKWGTSPRGPGAGGQRRLAEATGRSTPNAAHIKLSRETANAMGPVKRLPAALLGR